jgi:phospholipid-transporting ATPase
MKNPELTTLAIGDGANDVNMIAAAHVGIGISGLEGQQAARSSDYAIGQFKYLKTLLFYHGREAYRRNAYLISYMFYKNVLFVFPMFFFGFYSVFSGTPIYDNFLYQFFIYTYRLVKWFGFNTYTFTRQFSYHICHHLLNDW